MTITLSKAKANAEYNKKIERVALKIRKDAKANVNFIRAHAASRDESINGFILRAVTETIKRDKERAAKN